MGRKIKSCMPYDCGKEHSAFVLARSLRAACANSMIMQLQRSTCGTGLNAASTPCPKLNRLT